MMAKLTIDDAAGTGRHRTFEDAREQPLPGGLGRGRPRSSAFVSGGLRAAVLEPGIADVNDATKLGFDATGRYVALSHGQTNIDLFDAGTHQPMRSIGIAVQGLPYHAAFDPAGRTLAVVMDTVGVLTYDVAER